MSAALERILGETEDKKNTYPCVKESVIYNERRYHGPKLVQLCINNSRGVLSGPVGPIHY